MEMEAIFSDYFLLDVIPKMEMNNEANDATNKNKLQTQRKKYPMFQKLPNGDHKTHKQVDKSRSILKNKQMKSDTNINVLAIPEKSGTGTHEDNLISVLAANTYKQVIVTDKVGVKIANDAAKLEPVTHKEEEAKADAAGNAQLNVNILSTNLEYCDQNLITREGKSHEINAPGKEELKNNLNSSNTFVKKTNGAIPNLESDLQALLIRLALTSTDQDRPEINNENMNIESEPEINRAELVFVTTSLKSDEMDFLKIKAINSYSTRDWYLVKKFVKKWKKFIQVKKKASKTERQNALNAFFHKLETKKDGVHSQTDLLNKAKQNARDYSNYQHRYKMQKHIIALQKAKLEEQTRLIDELKYKKIVEASKNSVEDMREELRKTYFEIDRHLKPKIKCLTNELKIPEIEEQSLVLQCLKMPQFLQRMEKRAREREEKHALIRERRRQMEEDRVRIKQQAELAKAEMDKEERMRIIKELKEKRKREKIENIRKKQLAERMRALQVMADLHYERNLVSKCGLQPLKRLIEIKRDNFEKAKVHYRFQLLKNMFLKWMFHTEDMWIERNYKAEDFYRKKLLRRIFGAFKINHHELILKKQVADDYYDLYVVQLAFRKFRHGVEQIKCEEAIKWDRAVAYHNSNLTFKIFTCWRSLPALNALRREQEVRKARWRQKVLQVVPDYKPPEE